MSRRVFVRFGARRDTGVKFECVLREGNKFRARIFKDGAIEPLGEFDTHKQAKRAVAIALRQLKRGR